MASSRWRSSAGRMCRTSDPGGTCGCTFHIAHHLSCPRSGALACADTPCEARHRGPARPEGLARGRPPAMKGADRPPSRAALLTEALIADFDIAAWPSYSAGLHCSLKPSLLILTLLPGPHIQQTWQQCRSQQYGIQWTVQPCLEDVQHPTKLAACSVPPLTVDRGWTAELIDGVKSAALVLVHQAVQHSLHARLHCPLHDRCSPQCYC